MIGIERPRWISSSTLMELVASDLAGEETQRLIDDGGRREDGDEVVERDVERRQWNG